MRRHSWKSASFFLISLFSLLAPLLAINLRLRHSHSHSQRLPPAPFTDPDRNARVIPHDPQHPSQAPVPTFILPLAHPLNDPSTVFITPTEIGNHHWDPINGTPEGAYPSPSFAHSWFPKGNIPAPIGIRLEDDPALYLRDPSLLLTPMNRPPPDERASFPSPASLSLYDSDSHHATTSPNLLPSAPHQQQLLKKFAFIVLSSSPLTPSTCRHCQYIE